MQLLLWTSRSPSKASKFRSFVLMVNGYITKFLLAQPPSLSGGRLLKTSLLMLDAVGLAPTSTPWRGYQGPSQPVGTSSTVRTKLQDQLKPTGRGLESWWTSTPDVKHQRASWHPGLGTMFSEPLHETKVSGKSRWQHQLWSGSHLAATVCQGHLEQWK